MESVKNYDIVNDFKLNSVIKKKYFGQTSFRQAAKTKTSNDKIECGCIERNTSN